MATHKITLTDAEEFFYQHAGGSYDPSRETSSSGKVRNAIRLAMAEEEAKRKGWVVEWEIDTDADTTPTDEYFVSGAAHWIAVLTDEARTVLASLGSIDLGYADRGNTRVEASPSDAPYARVVEAELVLEAL